MKVKGEYELKFLKVRNASCLDKKLKLKYNVDTLLMSDMEEIKADNPLMQQQSNMSGALNVLNQLQMMNNGEKVC